MKASVYVNIFRKNTLLTSSTLTLESWGTKEIEGKLGKSDASTSLCGLMNERTANGV